MERKKFLKLINYGCQMNQADAERMAGQLQTIGYQPTERMEDADLILLNTCCVRESAEDKVYGKIGEIKHLKAENPQLILALWAAWRKKRAMP
jgi:tRNA-2-methylthio-N6-dimethylallyladenosine synthase